MPAKTTTKPRQKKFKTIEGDYLKLTEAASGYGFRLAWWVATLDDFGSVVGETNIRNKTQETLDRGELEIWIADQVASKFTNDIDAAGFYFDSKKRAQEALSAIDAALLDHEILRWPDWAILAKQAGWTPPEGWEP